MRFMIIVPASPETEQGPTGTEQQFADMQAYNEQMLKAGVFVDGQGLHPSAKGARVTWEDGDWVVTDGPFAEAKELIAGFTIIDVSSARGGPRVAQEVAGLVRARPRSGARAAAGLRARGLRRRVHPRSCASARSRCEPRPPATRPAPDRCRPSAVAEPRPRACESGGVSPTTGPRTDDVARTLEAVWRMEAAKVTAVVARLVGDVGLAEDLAQDAFVQALEQWPRDGIPQQAGRVAHVHGAAAGHRPHPSRRQPREQAAAGRTPGGAEGGRAGRGRLRRGPARTSTTTSSA